MACTICAKSFGFFTKEHGCPVCKYSFCSGCLKYKLVRDGKKLNVCLRCSTLASTDGAAKPAQTLPSTTAVPSVSARTASVGHTKETTSSAPPSAKAPIQETVLNEDEIIRSKLNALKGKSEENETATPIAPAAPTSTSADENTDIEKRLAALKGVEYKDYKNAAQKFLTADDRTEEEQVQDLIGRFVGEAKLDTVMDSRRQEQDEEIMKRLNALKQFPGAGASTSNAPQPQRTDPVLPESDSDGSLNDEELARKLAEKYAEEGRLAAKLTPDDSDEEILRPPAPTLDDEEELPWCTICNEDAVLRCRGCDNDLYCRPCYKEFHCDEDPREHQTVAFKPKNRKNR